jgi:8-oxo-dGTP pyrophosphatase MutT (NUDIX family)
MNAIAQKMFARKTADSDTRVRAGVGVFVRDNAGNILLEKRRDCGLWGLPGGRIDPGESISEAAVREVKEETGFDICITRFIGVYSEPLDRIVTYPDNGDVVQLIDIIIEAAIVSGSLAVSQESFDVRFFNREDLPADIAPPALVPIQDYFEGMIGVLR